MRNRISCKTYRHIADRSVRAGFVSLELRVRQLLYLKLFYFFRQCDYANPRKI